MTPHARTDIQQQNRGKEQQPSPGQVKWPSLASKICQLPRVGGQEVREDEKDRQSEPNIDASAQPRSQKAGFNDAGRGCLCHGSRAGALALPSRVGVNVSVAVVPEITTGFMQFHE
jgi:hypothetical protein